MIATAGLVVNLDRKPIHGRVAKDCAACRTPYLGAVGPTFNFLLWNADITHLQNPFDLDAALECGDALYRGDADAPHPRVDHLVKEAHHLVQSYDYRSNKDQFRQLVGVDHL